MATQFKQDQLSFLEPEKKELIICGVDEAGRGTLAGPVFAAAVILDPDKPIEGLKDSKQLSEKERLRLARLIKENAKAWAIAQASVEEIDELNILWASMLAMKRAIESLEIAPTKALIDGHKVPNDMAIECEAIVKGDQTEPAISAASILAKTARDATMEMLSRQYPGYGFDKHKGYGTGEHLSALMQFGPSIIHRKTFSPVKEILASIKTGKIKPSSSKGAVKTKIDFSFLTKKSGPTDFKRIRWPRKMVALVCAPHPDDFDAISMTMRYLQEQGHAIYAIVCETASGIDPQRALRLSPEKRTLLRNKEQRRSFKLFGLPKSNYKILSLKNADDAQVDLCPENVLVLEDIVKQIKPDILFMPHGNDTNRAHRAMCSMMKTVASKSDYPMALFFNSDVKTVDMRKDFYVSFNETQAKWKAQLLLCHESQQQRNLKQRGHGFDERVLRFNQKTAQNLNLKATYAESFELFVSLSML